MIFPTFHQRWCRQELCTDTAHRGRLVTINPANADHYPVAVQLVQPRIPGALPSIILTGHMGVVASALAAQRRPRGCSAALAAGEAQQAPEREEARRRLLYQARSGNHWSDAPTQVYPCTGPLMTPGQEHRGRGGRWGREP